MREVVELKLEETDIQEAVLIWLRTLGYVPTSGAWLQVAGGSVSITVPITAESMCKVKK